MQQVTWGAVEGTRDVYSGGKPREYMTATDLWKRDMFYLDPDCRSWSGAWQQLLNSLYLKEQFKCRSGDYQQGSWEGIPALNEGKSGTASQITLNLRVKIRSLWGPAKQRRWVKQNPCNRKISGGHCDKQDHLKGSHTPLQLIVVT